MNDLVYVFDYRTSTGTFLPFRVPTIMARAICRVGRFLDYADSPWGF